MNFFNTIFVFASAFLFLSLAVANAVNQPLPSEIDPNHLPCGGDFKPSRYDKVYPCRWQNFVKDWSMGDLVFNCYNVPAKTEAWKIQYDVNFESTYNAIPPYTITAFNITDMENPRTDIANYYEVAVDDRRDDDSIPKCINHLSSSKGCINDSNEDNKTYGYFKGADSDAPESITVQVRIRKDPDSDANSCLSMIAEHISIVSQ